MRTRLTPDSNIETIALKIASPERIKEWSFGEVTKPETINYRTQRSEKNGLFDEKIFGPDKDYECYCGKYRGIRYKGIVCEKCGVEITRSIVRRERMGHIELATVVSHIWFLKSMPSRIGLILGIPTADLEKVIYFAGYIITKVSEEDRIKFLKDLDSEYKAKIKSLQDNKTKEAVKEMLLNAKREIESIQEGRVLDEVEYYNFGMKYGTMFEANIGAEAIYNIFKKIDLSKLLLQLRAELKEASSLETGKINKRIGVVSAMINSNIRPEWMFLTHIPVIPPALRPMVPLDGGRYATSDVNDLYRRVINRNNRLKKLKEIHAPDVILRNEKRILQEAVDALIDNTVRHGGASGAVNQSQRRPLKSLADNLKGKRGIFRQNLLGKRVDYSGRSVIVVGPDLDLNQCGLPKHMVLELFKPFVISDLLKKELAYNIRGASKLIEDGIPEVWAILEEVISDRFVLLNRAPTLHRLGIQAFKPVLIEGNAIQLHPLVCSAFNADFDGDQMAVHVPLSDEAQLEAREIMASDKNILKPGSGDPTVSAKMLDIVLGCYWMTKEIPGEKGEGKFFSSPNPAITSYDLGAVSFRAKIKVLPPSSVKYKQFEDKIFETTVGRLLFNSILPRDYPFINSEINRDRISSLVDDLIEKYGIENVPKIIDKIKTFGFRYATHSGITWGLDDILIPEGKKNLVSVAKKKADAIMSHFNSGLISKEERLRQNMEVWLGAKAELEKLMPSTLPKNGPVSDMVFSKARGSMSNITQMAGMKGLITNTAGETIEFPIISCSKEGLTPLEYFITTHGARKGLTDTALNTAKSGYLTRKMFVVAQDTIITEDDCGTKEGVIIDKHAIAGIETSIAKHIKGRFLSADVIAPDGAVMFKKDSLINKKDAQLIETSGVTSVSVRSPLSCKTLNGICVKCYGVDLGKNKVVELGEAVGTVAGQAIGEPGTQLTMRTFHAGGTASVSGDIVSGLPRVEELFEKRKPKNPAVVCGVGGTVSEIIQNDKEKIIKITPNLEDRTKSKGMVEYPISLNRSILVKVGDEVKKGDIITDGSADIDELFKYAGRNKTIDYIIHEINKPYELQGETVSRKHIETIVRQMFSRRKIKNPGDTIFLEGDLVELSFLAEENTRVKALGKEEAKSEGVVMGITDVSLSRKSFLAAASFQHTTRMLISSAIRGNADELVGLMENVILGRLIPAGTGFKNSKKAKMIEDMRANRPAVYEDRNRFL
ncbi:MAG: DNA-directed RNA polymerase subunit beta' [Candidatus Zambryskibacteria bacterium RIFCSPLOWO2_02_FULL_39_26]|uniref:DNA-directed RNA polymerase subunit beta' n=1 Tax=Candidatus Zambryskibacteria bacterium RIFCSPLOWO2_12_FULL_39_23 TaxID=1802776 RepID=A0A1G2UT40_9BACT|nr:MAG: DNA-directed RNA polymerase subunit beta' [Candidatus Zambryskibacteria bacterium RIFCSPHIGHO2_12_FULL_39_47]OHB09481.1 MAG: DNA-directed RNA polymerase subunit beta' [Candidatus Zambryskibacteria bacterium RIFCSPLOWO2_02_FULL_39_26]OHB12557.1 MAG: DNA-directed RNA polymerase subunit beta' [Candidatus Zambryskibacteria bacterium RIFCSPLOWO2_12_FULL_39_23]